MCTLRTYGACQQHARCHSARRPGGYGHSLSCTAAQHLACQVSAVPLHWVYSHPLTSLFAGDAWPACSHTTRITRVS